ncbi:hypothetical protein [Oceanicola sp. 502str15]|uniref:hypothetical protein n=1 Tax=Oceanicola sp. 502str15 TaxID=2696061 RepID=UPI0020943E08|nr:hypothetical protein [Oceanicola sp. 502str15]MCO6382247.1 hypothetical protein [Oceanicola sp. 502str15]
MSQIPDLTPDCSRCAALCCMALAFDAGEDFAIDKPAGLPCPKLERHLCSIYEDLEEEGFSGCARYSCTGAGQRVTQEVFAGKSWQDEPELAAPMSEALRQMKAVHEALELLAMAENLGLEDYDEEVREALLTALTPEEGFTPETLAATAAPLKRVPAFLATLRDYI